MNLVYTGLELRRVLRDYVSMFFIAVLPAFFYLMFGASQEFSAQSAGNGNVGMYVMISMAAYGAVTATSGIGGMAAVERMQGWGRQLGLTPLRDTSYVQMKAVVAVAVAAIPILSIYLLGVLTDAEGSASAWLLSATIVLVGSVMFALYGLVFGLAFRSEAAVGAASGSLVILPFWATFLPPLGHLLTLAKFTPLYGYVSLARYPLTEGYVVNTTNGAVTHCRPCGCPLLTVCLWA
jgi:ABC-2 type transport system permease protein